MNPLENFNSSKHFEAIQNLFSLDEIIIPLFQFVGIEEIMQCSLVCRKWNTGSQKDCLWKIFFAKVCPNREEYLKPNSFKEAFIHFYLNLRSGIYSSHTLKVDGDGPNHITAENETLCAEKNGSVMVWKLPEETLKNKFTIQKNYSFQESITEIYLHLGTLYVGYQQGKIEAWDLESATCVKTFAEHKDEMVYDQGVKSIAIADQRLYSTCGGTKKIWDLATAKCLAVENTIKKEKNNRKAYCAKLTVEENNFYSGFSSGTILFKNLETQEEKIFNGYDELKSKWRYQEYEPMRSLISTGGILYAHSTYSGIRIWDFTAKKTSELIHPMTVLCDDGINAIGQIAATNGCLYILWINDSEYSKNEIIVRDFCATHETILKEIADPFKEGYNYFKRDPMKIAKDRFNRMSEEIKEGVYKEYFLLVKEKNNLAGIYEQNQNLCKSLFEKDVSIDISEAILNYTQVTSKIGFGDHLGIY